jgi:hypothetical protein
MSILRHFNKHQGWHNGKRTYNGGGGGWNPISAVTDTISSALGTDGGGGGVLGALASVDPGPAIGSGLAQLDKTVNQNIPGGWITVGGLAAGGLALAYAPEVMALAESAGIAPEAAASELGIAPINAATGEVVPLATSTPGASSVLAAPDVAVNLGATNAGTVGSLNAALPAAGSVGGAGAGLSAELAPGTVLGTGLPGGGAIGASYAVGANGLPATDFFGNYIPASSVNFGGVPETIAGTTSATNTDMAKLLKQGATSALSNSAQQLAQGANARPLDLLTAVRNNQSPFSYTPVTPIQDRKPDLSALAELLKQG